MRYAQNLKNKIYLHNKKFNYYKAAYSHTYVYAGTELSIAMGILFHEIARAVCFWKKIEQIKQTKHKIDCISCEQSVSATYIRCPHCEGCTK